MMFYMYCMKIISPIGIYIFQGDTNFKDKYLTCHVTQPPKKLLYSAMIYHLLHMDF